MNTNEEKGGATATLTAMPIAPFRNLTDGALRDIRRIYEALPASRDTLGVLFAVDAAQTTPTDTWIGYFVETACAQLIWDERPTGTLSSADAEWVLRKFDDAPTVACLALLVRLVEEAHRVPTSFASDVRRRASLFASLAEVRVAPGRPTAVPYLRLVA